VELITETMRAEKIVQFLATALTSGQEMIYRALQIRMFGKSQTTDSTNRVDSDKYLLLACNSHSNV
jgi:hypothetical protein